MTDRGQPTRRNVTADMRVTHRPGDKSVDSVDNSGSALPLRVTEGPEEGTNGSLVNAVDDEKPERRTERSNDVGPNEAGGHPASEASRPREDSRPQGRDLARAALRAAKERAAARGTEPGFRKPGARPVESRAMSGLSGQNPRRHRWSGPGFDERDPQPFGRLLARMSSQLGWNARLANGRVFGQWPTLVGADVAEHAQPVALNNGELTVRASSTAWATQLRLLQRQLLARIAAGVGNGVVTRMKIQGPTAPSWRKGPRHIPGRGPRDTYG